MWQVFKPKPNTNPDHTKVLLSPKTKTHIKLQRFYWTVVLRNYVELHGMGWITTFPVALPVSR